LKNPKQSKTQAAMDSTNNPTPATNDTPSDTSASQTKQMVDLKAIQEEPK